MRKRWWIAGAGAAVVAVMGGGVWWLVRPLSMPWTAEEIAAQQRALLDASMPPGEAAWPLIAEAIEELESIAASWPAPMTAQGTMVIDSLRLLPWEDPRLTSAKSAVAELAPVVDRLLEASRRPRLFADGDAAQVAGAWFDGDAFLPAARGRLHFSLLLVEARGALAGGDEAAFTRLIGAYAAIARTLDQSPLQITSIITSGMYSQLLNAIIEAVRDGDLSPQSCAALRAVVMDLESHLGRSGAFLWESERLWMYAETLRQAEATKAMSIRERLELRVRVLYGGVDSLSPFDEQYDWGWLQWLGSHSGGEIRERIEAQFAASAAWWDEPASARSDRVPHVSGFPDVGLMPGGEGEARARGIQDLLRARAVGVAALLDIEAHHARFGVWPATLDEVAGAAELHCPLTGAPLLYTPEPLDQTSAWPFLLRLPIDDALLARIDPPFTGVMSGINAYERPDRRIITQEDEAVDAEELRQYEWLVAPAD